MGFKIEDGKGTGIIAEVDSDHRLQTASVTSDRAVVSNLESGDAFVFTTLFLDIAAATETRLFYIKNTDTSRSLIVDSIVLSTDGGSTNFDKPTFARLYAGASEPTANQSEKDPGGLNTESSKRAEADLFIWDEVGSGMTQATTGLKIIENIFAMGFTSQVLPAKFVLGPTKTLTISMECSEAAKISIQLFAHY